MTAAMIVCCVESLSLLHFGLLDCLFLEVLIQSLVWINTLMHLLEHFQRYNVLLPPTCARLNDNHVCCEFGDSSADDTIQIEMAEIQQANTMACDLLTAWGFQRHF